MKPTPSSSNTDSARSREASRRRTGGNGTVVADGATDLLERLQPEASPVLERPAVLVGPVVVDAHEDWTGGVAPQHAPYIHDVEAGVACTNGRGHVVLWMLTDVPLSIAITAPIHEGVLGADS